MASWKTKYQDEKSMRKKEDDEETFFLSVPSSTSSSVNGSETNSTTRRNSFSGKQFNLRRIPIVYKAIFGLFILASCLGLFMNSKDESKTSSYNPLKYGKYAIRMNVEEAYHQRLYEIHTNILSNKTELEGDLNLNGGIPTYEQYRSRLLDIYTRFFSPPLVATDPFEIWKNVESHLTPFKKPSPQNTWQEFPKVISTSVYNKTNVTATFETWERRNPDWRIDLIDDEGADKFIKSAFHMLGRYNPEDNLENKQIKPLSPQTSFMEILNLMPETIMKVDTFRYFKIFFDGGLYVDSDTICNFPIKNWPGLYTSHDNITQEDDFILRFLTKIAFDDQQRQAKESLREKGLKALTSLYKSNKEKDRFYRNHKHFSDPDRIQKQRERVQFWKQPSLILALEEDSFLSKDDWKKFLYARPLQLTQWAFLAKPFHPIFLDALGTIMERTDIYNQTKIEKPKETISDEDKKKKKEEVKEIHNVLDWTGPGMLTDAVFRYLGAVYGIHPNQLKYNHKAARVGDTLIYPQKAFSAQDAANNTNEFFVINHHHLHEWWSPNYNLNLNEKAKKTTIPVQTNKT